MSAAISSGARLLKGRCHRPQRVDTTAADIHPPFADGLCGWRWASSIPRNATSSITKQTGNRIRNSPEPNPSCFKSSNGDLPRLVAETCMITTPHTDAARKAGNPFRKSRRVVVCKQNAAPNAPTTAAAE